MVDEKTGSGKFLDDGQSYKAIIAELPAGVRAEYESFGALNLEAAFPNRKLVVYTLTNGKPRGVDLWCLGGLRIDKVLGPVCELELASGEVLDISTLPVKVGNRDVFVHMPQRFELRWKGKDNPRGAIQFAVHYAVLTKTRSKAHHQVEGHTYVETLNKFGERFPEYPLRY